MKKYLARDTKKMRWLGLVVVSIAAFTFLFLPIAQQLFVADDIRPATDDYCFLWHAEERSVIDFQRSVFRNSSGRVATIGIINLTYRGGEDALNVLPIIGWLLLLGGAAWFLREARRVREKNSSWKAPILGAGAITSLSYLFMPNIYQDFYWGPGVVNYTYAMASLFLVLGLLIRVATQKKTSNLQLAGLFAAGLLASMFNEPQTIFFIALSALSLLAALRIKALKLQPLPFVATGLAGITGLLVSLSTPGARQRLSSNSDDVSLLDTLGATIETSYDTFTSNVLWETLGIHALVAILAGFVFAKLFNPSRQNLIVLAGSWFFALSAYIGTVFLNIQTSAIDLVPPRTLLMGFIFISLAILLSGLLVGSWIQNLTKKDSNLNQAVLGILLVATSWTLAVQLPSHAEDARIFSAQLQTRGLLYDQRDAFIEPRKDDSPLYVQSLGLRGAIGDLKATYPHWVNDCFTEHKDAADIRAYEEFRL